MLEAMVRVDVLTSWSDSSVKPAASKYRRGCPGEHHRAAGRREAREVDRAAGERRHRLGQGRATDRGHDALHGRRLARVEHDAQAGLVHAHGVPDGRLSDPEPVDTGHGARGGHAGHGGDEGEVEVPTDATTVGAGQHCRPHRRRCSTPARTTSNGRNGPESPTPGTRA